MDNLKNMFDSMSSIFSPITKVLNDIGLPVTDDILMIVTVLIIILIVLIATNVIPNPISMPSKLFSGGSVDDEKITFTLYYVEWCPHCQVVKPEWEKLENDEELKHINIVKINCEENEDVVNEKNIEGFPTILLTHNGKETGYNGNREYADFKNYLQNL